MFLIDVVIMEELGEIYGIYFDNHCWLVTSFRLIDLEPLNQFTSVTEFTKSMKKMVLPILIRNKFKII